MLGLHVFTFYLILILTHLVTSKPKYSNSSPQSNRHFDTNYGDDDDGRYDPRSDPNYDPQYDSEQRNRGNYRESDDNMRNNRYTESDSDYTQPPPTERWRDDRYETYPAEGGPAEDTYPTDQRRGPRSKGPPQKRIVEKYTKSLPSLLLVSCSSSVFAFLSSIALLNFMLSKAPLYATAAIAAVSFLFTFVPGEAGSFSRSSGVFLLLLIQRASLHAFLGRLLRQLIALISLTKRAGFPWLEDPWKYRPRGSKDIDFNMTSTMIASVLLGGILGWSIGRCIPLFPTWIGTLAGVGFLTYACTMSDTFGDLVRFLGNSVAESYGEVMTASREVGLTDEGSVLLGRVLTLFKLLDKKFQLIPKLQAIFIFIMSKITEIIARFRQQDNNRAGGPVREEESRRYDY